MGCDIHLHTEIKVNGTWYHYGAPNGERCYALFALIAGVRGNPRGAAPDGCEPVARDRGVPDDASVVTRIACEDYAQDGHGHTWLGAADLVELERRWRAMLEDKSQASRYARGDLEAEHAGFFFGNSWAGWALYPDESCNKSLRGLGVEDVRWILWFDN